jgi:hypothetical protein
VNVIVPKNQTLFALANNLQNVLFIIPIQAFFPFSSTKLDAAPIGSSLEVVNENPPPNPAVN